MPALRKNKSILLAVTALFLSSCSLFQGRETAGQYTDDSVITTKVKEAFVADANIKSTQINVETMQGVVQLSGFVDSATMEARAVRIARQVQGVKDVKDSIVIRSTQAQ